MPIEKLRHQVPGEECHPGGYQVERQPSKPAAPDEMKDKPEAGGNQQGKVEAREGQ